ncbi:hypothetical protein JFV29_12050 [Peribacillus sp. TH16]|uniref:hypothetical protein n=1 Tax=Peribacillus TaxID=2675229 RepID=UPI00070AAF16|nr:MULTISPECIES: hypothetical protein [Peribacillus]KRF67226.1 hypothetical protein ASG99_16485 [Bacillus sp. Soil768D1]MBK5482623.1 hypothetical protein [Peribacillus sp. TH16]
MSHKTYSEQIKKDSVLLNYAPDDEHISLFALISFVAHEVIDTTKTMHEKVNDWIDANIKNIE